MRDGDCRPSVAFISDFGDAKEYQEKGNIFHDGRDFELANREEINPFLPEEEKIIENYSIY